MSTMRLTFLYPHLFRSIRVGEPAAQSATRTCYNRPSSRKATFVTTPRKKQRFVQRHGKAVQPFLAPGDTTEDTKVLVADGAAASTNATGSEQTGGSEAKNIAEKEVSPLAPFSDETQAAAYIPGDSQFKFMAGSPDSGTIPIQQAAANTMDHNAPLATVLHMDPPSDQPPSDPNIPHMHAPPYVHHFDSYTLVKQVEDGGFTGGQAVTSMKAVRGLLALNLDIAREGLVSKSDVENETYLFRAACSELRTEIQNTRKGNEEKMRRERTLLQHEFDILGQKLTQELLTLKDDLKGMFNDRKMDVRTEQRSMESAIQELNYKITVLLNSDSKSEVEGLRWVLTRRSVLAIVFMAFMVLSSLRFASYRAHEEELERKRQDKARDEARKRGMHRNNDMIDGGSQTGDGLPAAAAAIEALSAN